MSHYFHTERAHPSGDTALLHLIGNGFHMAGGTTAGNNHQVSKSGEIAHIENADILRLQFIERVNNYAF